MPIIGFLNGHIEQLKRQGHFAVLFQDPLITETEAKTVFKAEALLKVLKVIIFLPRGPSDEGNGGTTYVKDCTFLFVVVFFDYF